VPSRLSPRWQGGGSILNGFPSAVGRAKVSPEEIFSRFPPLVVDLLVRDSVHRPLRPPPIAEIDLTHRFLPFSPVEAPSGPCASIRGVSRKLTEHQKREAIRRRDRDGEPVREIARSHNVSHSTISRLAM
jgi:hypothetical protein